MSNEFVMVPRELAERIAASIGYEERDELQEILAKPSMRQGEPVALPAAKELVRAWGHDMGGNYEEGTAFGWNACLDEIAKLGPLYPATADPGEVERLRAELVEWKERCRRNNDEAMSWMAKYDILRAQLTERDALLRKVVKKGSISRAETMQAIALIGGEVEVECRECAGTGGIGHMEICEHCKGSGFTKVSASAEPSAPVEIDERAAFEKAVVDKAERFHPNLDQYGEHPDAEYRDANIEWAWGLWKARAALERKP